MAVNYDPQKAHEYYMKHRNLKGRHSTKGWSQQKKEQWAFAKEQLSEEHKAINKGITDDSKEKRRALSEAAKQRIASIREAIKNASPEEKAEIRERVQGMVDNVRNQLKSDKEGLTANTKVAREQEKNAYSARKDQVYQTIKAMGGGNKKGKRKK